MEVLNVCLSPEIHRELLHRPVSGYVPEEIWKKAGEPAITSFSLSHLFCSVEIKAILSIIFMSQRGGRGLTLD